MKFFEVAKWTIAFLHTPEGQGLLHFSEELLTYLWVHRPADAAYLPRLVEQFKAARNIPA